MACTCIMFSLADELGILKLGTMSDCLLPSSDMDAFRKILQKANSVVILTGAGVSAESGVPTFRGAGGLWRTYSAQNLATPSAFRSNPSLVWEFYHHRRENMASKSPNNVITDSLTRMISSL